MPGTLGPPCQSAANLGAKPRDHHLTLLSPSTRHPPVPRPPQAQPHPSRSLVGKQAARDEEGIRVEFACKEIGDHEHTILGASRLQYALYAHTKYQVSQTSLQVAGRGSREEVDQEAEAVMVVVEEEEDNTAVTFANDRGKEVARRLEDGEHVGREYFAPQVSVVTRCGPRQPSFHEGRDQSADN